MTPREFQNHSHSYGPPHKVVGELTTTWTRCTTQIYHKIDIFHFCFARCHALEHAAVVLTFTSPEGTSDAGQRTLPHTARAGSAPHRGNTTTFWSSGFVAWYTVRLLASNELISLFASSFSFGGATPAETAPSACIPPIMVAAIMWWSA